MTKPTPAHRRRIAALLTLVVAPLGAHAARAQEARAPHGLVIRRVMADPSTARDEAGEWITIGNVTDHDVDLRGWRLRSGHDRGFTVRASLRVPAHGTVTLGRSADRARNGGVPVDLAITGIALGNAGDWLALDDPRGVMADSLAWGRASSGRAIEHGAAALAAPASAAVPPRPAPLPAPVPAPSPAVAPSELVVRVLDVGQGDAILIQNGGSNILVDGGPNPAALGRHLDALGLNGGTIDAVILTHRHADHYQGLRELFATRRHLTVRYFWENQDPSPNATLARLRDSIAARVSAGSLVYRDTDDPCGTGQPLCIVTMKGGARLEILRPDPQAQDPNNRSPALKLVGPDSASFTMWMAGDGEFEAIDYFDRLAGYAHAPGMRVDVLKADHHGSCNGVTDRYLELTHPSLAVVSLGAINDYGHMHAQAKALYARHGVPWYRTDQNGTIVLRSSGLPGERYGVSVERGGMNMDGPSDRASTSAACR